jgi:hypothetical protein
MDLLREVAGYWPFAAALGWLVVAGFPIGLLMSRLRVERLQGMWLTAEMGLVERATYALATLTDHPELAAGWLVLKVGSNWGAWKTYPGVFNGFLTGTGLSLLFGASAGVLPGALASGNDPLVVGLIVGPLTMTLLVALTRWSSDKWPGRAVRWLLNPGTLMGEAPPPNADLEGSLKEC